MEIHRHDMTPIFHKFYFILITRRFALVDRRKCLACKSHVIHSYFLRLIKCISAILHHSSAEINILMQKDTWRSKRAHAPSHMYTLVSHISALCLYICLEWSLAFSRLISVSWVAVRQNFHDILLHGMCDEPICVRTLSSHCRGPFRWISIQHGVLVTVCRLKGNHILF